MELVDFIHNFHYSDAECGSTSRNFLLQPSGLDNTEKNQRMKSIFQKLSKEPMEACKCKTVETPLLQQQVGLAGGLRGGLG